MEINGRQIQYDRSGVGHCWVDAEDIFADDHEYLFAAIEEGDGHPRSGWMEVQIADRHYRYADSVDGWAGRGD